MLRDSFYSNIENDTKKYKELNDFLNDFFKWEDSFWEYRKNWEKMAGSMFFKWYNKQKIVKYVYDVEELNDISASGFPENESEYYSHSYMYSTIFNIFVEYIVYDLPKELMKERLEYNCIKF